MPLLGGIGLRSLFFSQLLRNKLIFTTTSLSKAINCMIFKDNSLNSAGALWFLHKWTPSEIWTFLPVAWANIACLKRSGNISPRVFNKLLRAFTKCLSCAVWHGLAKLLINETLVSYLSFYQTADGRQGWNFSYVSIYVYYSDTVGLKSHTLIYVKYRYISCYYHFNIIYCWLKKGSSKLN